MTRSWSLLKSAPGQVLLFAKAFLLYAIVDVHLCRRCRHEMILLGISRKLLELATSKFTKKLPSSTGGGQLLGKFYTFVRVNCGSCSGRDFSITFQPILKWFTGLETAIQVLHFLLCNLIDIFAPWPRKWGSSGPSVVYALRQNSSFWFYRKLQKVAASKFSRV